MKKFVECIRCGIEFEELYEPPWCYSCYMILAEEEHAVSR